ncbi:MAG: DUF4296 domain-containing protein [Polaribacter sp.]
MKNLRILFCFIFLYSCTSNTIFEKPKDLIPKDTMSLLIQELMIASSAKYQKNKSLESQINYLPLVYNRFKIDSTRFKESNLYYASEMDVYKEIVEDAKNSIDKKKAFVTDLKTKFDSIRRDSIEKSKIKTSVLDTIQDPDAN